MPFGKDFFLWIRFAVLVLKVLMEVFGDDGVAETAREVVAKMDKLTPEKLSGLINKTA